MLLIIIGLIGLWLGTKMIITGSLGIAKLFNLSHTFVGLGILAVGTDLPEVFVTINASILNLKGIETSGIITGNAIGSSISQITFILGVAGLFISFTMRKNELLRDGITLIFSIILLFAFGFDGTISRLEGLILLLVYVFYYILLMKSQKEHTDDNSSGKIYSKSSLAALLIIGFSILIFSSHLVVENAMLLAEKWGVAQSFVGIAIIGLGTSLPELAVSVGAAIRKSAGMSIGNIIGSNIFDGLVPIGIGGLISSTNIEKNILTYDIPVLMGITILVLLFLKTKKGISKQKGIFLIIIYIIYILTKLFLF